MPSSLTAWAQGTEAAPGMWPRALGALLLVAGHRDQLAGVLLRAADVDQARVAVERVLDLVAQGADVVVGLGWP